MVSVKMKEHQNSMKAKQTSLALFMLYSNTGHKIDLNSSKQIDQIENHRVRTLRETIEIEKMGKINKRVDAQYTHNEDPFLKTIIETFQKLTINSHNCLLLIRTRHRPLASQRQPIEKNISPLNILNHFGKAQTGNVILHHS